MRESTGDDDDDDDGGEGREREGEGDADETCKGMTGGMRNNDFRRRRVTRVCVYVVVMDRIMVLIFKWFLPVGGDKRVRAGCCLPRWIDAWLDF